MERGELKINSKKKELMVSAKSRRDGILDDKDTHNDNLKQVESFEYLGENDY